MDYDISKTDLISILLDKENKRLLPLEDKNGELRHYKQLATIKKDEDIYCLLKPFGNSFSSVAYLFKVEKAEGYCSLTTKIDKLEKQTIIDKIKKFIPALATER